MSYRQRAVGPASVVALALSCCSPRHTGGNDARTDLSKSSSSGRDSGAIVPPREIAPVDTTLGNSGEASVPIIPEPARNSGTNAVPFAQVPYRGLSLAGAEFAASIGGTFDGNTLGTIPGSYYYPDKDWPDDNYPGSYGQTAYPYYKSKGFNTFRLPFRWERLQRKLNADFDSGELAHFQQTVRDMQAAGFFVVLDAHNYGRYAHASQVVSGEIASVVGTPGVPYAGFADLWRRLATMYKDQPSVIFGLMNEPFGYDDRSMWLKAANAAIAAIRSTGAKNLVLVGGNEFSDAAHWEDLSDDLKNIRDPGNNFAYEVHVYLDVDKNGSGNSCPDTKIGSKQLQPFTDWARKHKARGFLGEFSAGTDVHAERKCLDALEDELRHLEQNSDVYIGWTYWAGGQGWGTQSAMESSVITRTNSPQMTVLEKHTK